MGASQSGSSASVTPSSNAVGMQHERGCNLKAKTLLLTSADGTKIHAEAIGDPTKPALVFIHGFSLSSVVFDNIFVDPAWVSEAYMVRYDVRGHGRSDKPVDEDAWASRRLADDFDTVVRRFDLCRPFVAGWSMGATHIADILSFHPPSYLAGIIYITALPYLGPLLHSVGSPAALACLPGLTQTGDVDAFQDAARSFVDLCADFDGGDDADEESGLARGHALRLACLGAVLMQPRAVTARLLARTQDANALFDAGGVQGGDSLPLLIVNGGRDRVTRGQEVVRVMEGWAAESLRVVELSAADHMPWVSRCAGSFRREVLGWVHGVAGGR